MTGNVFPLNSETILIVEKARNGQEKIWKAYLAIAEDLGEANHPDKDLIYWFENAAIINSNGEAYGQSKDASNTFIRAVTAAGLAINEKSPTKEGIQSTSDEIGRKVLKDVLNIGGVTNVASMLNEDISAALNAGGQKLEGWGGSFFYWDANVEIDGGTTTVGDYIQSHPDRLEDFVTVAATGLAVTLIREFDQLTDLALPTGEVHPALPAISENPLPEPLVYEVQQRAAEIIGGGNPSGGRNTFGRYFLNEGTGEWNYVPRIGDPVLVTDLTTIVDLDARRAIRLVNHDQRNGDLVEDTMEAIGPAWPAPWGLAELYSPPESGVSVQTYMDPQGIPTYLTGRLIILMGAK